MLGLFSTGKLASSLAALQLDADTTYAMCIVPGAIHPTSALHFHFSIWEKKIRLCCMHVYSLINDKVIINVSNEKMLKICKYNSVVLAPSMVTAPGLTTMVQLN